MKDLCPNISDWWYESCPTHEWVGRWVKSHSSISRNIMSNTWMSHVPHIIDCLFVCVAIDWCCLYYCTRNSPVALLEALFALESFGLFVYVAMSCRTHQRYHLLSGGKHVGREHGRDSVAKVDLGVIGNSHRARVLQELFGEEQFVCLCLLL